MGEENGVSVHYIVAVVAPEEGDAIRVEDHRDDAAREADQQAKLHGPLRTSVDEPTAVTSRPKGLGWDDQTTPKQNRPPSSKANETKTVPLKATTRTARPGTPKTGK